MAHMRRTARGFLVVEVDRKCRRELSVHRDPKLPFATTAANGRDGCGFRPFRCDGQRRGCADSGHSTKRDRLTEFRGEADTRSMNKSRETQKGASGVTS